VNFKIAAGLAAGLLSVPAFSAPVTINFEGVGNGYGSIADYYNGGTDIPVSGPASSGANYGVHFGLDLVAVDDPNNIANAPGPGATVMGVGGGGGDNSMTVASGFNQLSLYYSATSDTSITVSFTNGASQIYQLVANDGACGAGPGFCNWTQTTLDLGGLFAKAIDFGATSGVGAFDNVTINPVPLPAGVWLLGSSLLGLGGMLRRRNA
jgi:hypothetical protein